MEKACEMVKHYGPLAGRILFLKNLCIMAFGAGPLSLDARGKT